MTKIFAQVCIAVATLLIAGCGSVLPVMDYRHPTDTEFADFVKQIVGHVRCEISDTVNRNFDESRVSPRHILKDWAAKVELTIRANDKTNFNPTINVFNDLATNSQLFTGGVEANGTRELTMTYFIPFVELLDNQPHTPKNIRPPMDCSIVKLEPIAGDLGINQTVTAALQTWDSRNTLGDRVEKGPFDTITHRVNFYVIGNAGYTPTLKFVNLTANSTVPFLRAERTRTDQLLITMGPTTLGTRKVVAAYGRQLIKSVITPSSALDTSFDIERIKGALRIQP